MIELLDTRPDINVQETEYKRLLGYPDHYQLDGRALELVNWARQWYAQNGRPWIYARPTETLDISNGRLRISGVDFSSSSVRLQLLRAKAHMAMLTVVSAGQECEQYSRQLWLEGRPDEYFFLEVYGSAVVEHLIATTGWRFCDWAEQNGMAVLPHYSPGYSGWDISDQKKLWELIRQKANPAPPVEIQVLDTGMLNPRKSLLAVFGVTKQVNRVRNLAELIPCESCSLQSCQYRRTPYKRFLNQLEDVSRLQTHADEHLNGKSVNGSVLAQNAKYSVSTHALRIWSVERLQLETLEDRSVTARFRYEGTTCSNMGRRLEFEYRLKLASAEKGFKIVEMSCLPASGDTGHAYMCQYLSNAELLEHAIANEKPLLERPLNEVLSWERPFSPAGCYCDSASRQHKWGLVLEVVHFALSQKIIVQKDKFKT
ncbi:MAG TPA: hypothetical protein VGA99_08105 [bacterium]